jgi:hypothetical protein
MRRMPVLKAGSRRLKMPCEGLAKRLAKRLAAMR